MKSRGMITRRELNDKLVSTAESDRALGRERMSSISILNKAIQAQFKEQAKAFKAVLDDLPELSSIDVVRLCIHLALQKEDYEAVARWSKELIEYEKPKLSRREIVDKDDMQDLTDEELQEELAKEGVVVRLRKSDGTPVKKKLSLSDCVVESKRKTR
jgi:hypothetical protein